MLNHGEPMVKRFQINRMQGLLSTAFLVFLGFFCPVAQAATIFVPTDYPTIQEAVNSAVEGDTVVVSPGVYRERVSLKGIDITLRSADPEDPNVVASTIIGDEIGQPVGNYGILLEGSETSECRIEGLTISNSQSLGIWGRGASPYIGRCAISETRAGVGDCDGIIEDNFVCANGSVLYL